MLLNTPVRRAFVAGLLLLRLTVGNAQERVTDNGTARRDKFETRFLKFCDLAAAELGKELTPFVSRTNADPATHHMPFFEDAHAVRALAVGYDLTGKRAWLDACTHWADRIIEYQKAMIPHGAYYINHSRKPGEDKGQWNLADSGSIGMGVLATATRCTDPVRKAGYLRSVKGFARLVTDNYVKPEGGISNGLWPEYAGPWWCSSATFGTLAFLLYDETGDEEYLNVAKGALTWMLQQDFRSFKPITFEQRPSGTVFYVFEFYLAGLKHLPPESANYQRIVSQFDLALDWMSKNQKTRGASIPDYTERNVDLAGLPYLMYGFSGEAPRFREARAPADVELDYIGTLLLQQGQPNISRLMVWEVMTWGMLSHAERLRPGALMHTARAPEKP